MSMENVIAGTPSISVAHVHLPSESIKKNLHLENIHVHHIQGKLNTCGTALVNITARIHTPLHLTYIQIEA